MSRIYLALAAALQVALTGCGPHWPDVRAMGDAAFLSHHQTVATIDLLPLDLQIGSDGRNGQSADELAVSFGETATGAITSELTKRGYRVAAVIDWEGQYTLPSGAVAQALPREDLMQVAGSLESFGRAQARSPGRLLAPYLPVRLGSTGSDATLFVGGYGFAGEDPEGVTGDDVVKGVLIAVFIVAVVAILVVASKSGGGGGGSHVAGKVASSAGHTASYGAHHVPSFAHGVAFHAGPAASNAADAFGRVIVDTHIEIGDGETAPEPPARGDSRMLVEMTLVDNRTGQTLWHAREVFPANPSRTDHVNRVFGKMLESLPRVTPASR